MRTFALLGCFMVVFWFSLVLDIRSETRVLLPIPCLYRFFLRFLGAQHGLHECRFLGAQHGRHDEEKCFGLDR